MTGDEATEETMEIRFRFCEACDRWEWRPATWDTWHEVTERAAPIIDWLTKCLELRCGA